MRGGGGGGQGGEVEGVVPDAGAGVGAVWGVPLGRGLVGGLVGGRGEVPDAGGAAGVDVEFGVVGPERSAVMARSWKTSGAQSLLGVGVRGWVQANLG